MLLFYVYASSLQYAELALVTLGWVVVLQVGVLMLDRMRYGHALSADKWAAVVVILAAQAYLLLASSGPAPVSPASLPSTGRPPRRSRPPRRPTDDPIVGEASGVRGTMAAWESSRSRSSPGRRHRRARG